MNQSSNGLNKTEELTFMPEETFKLISGRSI